LKLASFNAADSAITVGACLLLIDVYNNRGKSGTTSL
jgi:lipoprotein signal peptidase